MTDTTDDEVRVEVDAGVMTITMDRQSNRNALAAELVNAVGDALVRARGDDTVRVVVLTNTGSTFCAGADLRGTSQEEPRYDLPTLLGMIMDSPVPVIGRIAGHCTGGGVGLAASCDISVMSRDARMGFTEVRLGAIPAMISVVCLPKMRRGDALELFLSGERITADRAAEVGLVNRAADADDLDDTVAGIVANVLRGGPNALAGAKDLIRDVPGMPRDEAFATTAATSAAFFAAPEAQEGIAAFREKRPAAWVPTAD